MIPTNNFGVQSEPFFLHGTEKEQYHIEELKIFQMSGGRLSTFNLWFLEIWGLIAQQVLLLQEIQDIEFTIEKGKLFMLQCRIGKRNGPAAIKMAVDMVDEGLINHKTAVMRVTPAQLDELLHPIIDPKEEMKIRPVAHGLPAGPGGASGMIVFSAPDAVAWAKTGKKVILVREETNPEDIEGMRVAQAILTARGGMTSHAALVARGWGKCCIVGCGNIAIDYLKKTMTIGKKTYKEGDWFTLNGTKGNLYEGNLKMMDASSENKILLKFLKFCDKSKRLKIRTNADTR